MSDWVEEQKEKYRAAVETLDEMRGLTAAEQNSTDNRGRLIAAFRTFWDSRPTEWEFARHTERMVLLPEMLHIMATYHR